MALAGTIAVEQGERLSLSQALDGIKEEFDASDAALGGIAVAMAVVGALGAIPFGWLADRTRRTALLAGAMVLWTACMGLHALAPGLLVIYLARLGVGLVEANGPAAVSLLADYYPVQRRARMMGLYQLGAGLGGLVGIAAAGPLIDSYGWRAAFVLWVPIGLVVAAFIAVQPDPERGAQDADLHADLSGTGDGRTLEGELVAPFDLPPPGRTGTLDYATADLRAVLGELRRIPTMWYAVVALTISQSFLAALGYWGIEFFKRAHDLSASAAGGYAAVLGAGSILGLVGGGVVSDRLFRRGVLNARVYVAAFGSVVATVLLLPALLVEDLLLSGVFFFVAGAFVTLPVAPAEALMSDVVVAPLRGRAASARGIVRSIAAASPALIGVLSDATTLRTALAVTTPLYAIGGLVMLRAARTYPRDLAFVVAEAGRLSVPPIAERQDALFSTPIAERGD